MTRNLELIAQRGSQSSGQLDILPAMVLPECLFPDRLPTTAEPLGPTPVFCSYIFILLHLRLLPHPNALTAPLPSNTCAASSSSARVVRKVNQGHYPVHTNF